VEQHYKKEECYNMNIGGKGGWNYVNSSGINLGDNHYMRRSPEAREKASNAGKLRAGNKKYVDIARQNLKKAVEVNTGKKRPEHSNFMKTWAKNNWEKNRENIMYKLSSEFKVISPIGEEYITNRLKDWCEQNNLPYTKIWISSYRDGKQITKGRAKGWKCELI